MGEIKIKILAFFYAVIFAHEIMWLRKKYGQSKKLPADKGE